MTSEQSVSPVMLTGSRGSYTHNHSLLGRGKYGQVWRGVEKNTERPVALKTISKRNFKAGSNAAWRIEREVRLQYLIGQHANIVQLLDSCGNAQLDDDSDITLAMELCEGGDILQQIQKLDHIPEEQSRRYFVQLVSAMTHAHAKGVVHRDLKVENILLDRDGNVKLADWGFAGEYGAEHGLLSEFYGSLPYASPEIVAGTPYTGPEVDVWSVGVVLYAMVTGHFPFHGATDRSVARRIVSAAYTMPAYLSLECQDLISSILIADPTKRPSMQKILEHPWCQPELVTEDDDMNEALQACRSLSSLDITSQLSNASEEPTSPVICHSPKIAQESIAKLIPPVTIIITDCSSHSQQQSEQQQHQHVLSPAIGSPPSSSPTLSGGLESMDSNSWNLSLMSSATNEQSFSSSSSSTLQAPHVPHSRTLSMSSSASSVESDASGSSNSSSCSGSHLVPSKIGQSGLTTKSLASGKRNSGSGPVSPRVRQRMAQLWHRLVGRNPSEISPR